MASSSSPASSMSLLPPSSLPSSHTSSYVGEWEYDVFLCFRGDTRFGFTSHLMKALSDNQIKTFIDNKLEKTESIDELISILQRSALSVVVFSEKFADSISCLDEVVTIARRMSKFGHRVLPVFCKVDPSDVTDDSGSYATTIDREYKDRSTYSEDKKRWMDALKAVANCAGHTSQAIKIESDLIEAIVKDVQKRLEDMSPSIKSANLVGMGSRILEVERLLAMDTLDDTRIIGLWGMGGVGKTTLAEACYKRIISSNKGIKYCFIGSIAEKCGKWHGGEGMVNELYSSLLSENIVDRQYLDISYRRGRLSRSRVFIVLDDVETPSQLEQILLGDVIMNPAELFAPGSRIIVTTRDKRVLDYAKAMIYNVAGLNDIESIELFSLRAFRQHQPSHDWVDLSHLAASYCVGNPLALIILGGALFGQDQHYWRSFLSELKLIQNPNVGDILTKSYDKLGTEEKKIFLDVACLLHGISRSRLIGYMVTMHPSAYAKVKDLIDRSLLTCVSGEIEEKIVVHDLLKEMAWNIVNEEPKLHKRSRLVDPDDIHKLLTTREPQLVNLMVLDLSCCRNLIAIPNISRSSNLEELLLSECKSLVEVPSHVQYLTKLITLDLSYCKNLKRLPPKLDSKLLKHVRMSKCFKVMHCPEINSKELVVLNLYETSLVELPNAIYNVKKDGVLYLYGKNITKFPAVTTSLKEYQLGHTSIREMDLHDYHQASSELLPRFRELHLFGNSQLKSLPESVWSMVSYRLRICGNPLIESLPEISEPVNGLTDLHITNCGGLKSLPSNLGNIKSLTWLDLSETGITSLPSSIQELQQLTSIDLRCCKSLVSIPSGIHKLSKLSNLDLQGCVSVRSLPELPPNLERLDRYNLVCSRSEIPDWFTYKSEDCIVKVELPLLKHSDQPMLKAIAFGFVYFLQHGHGYHPVDMECECEVDNTTVASWSFDILVYNVNESLSGKLWLAFDNNLLGHSPCEDLACLSEMILDCCTSLGSLPDTIHKLPDLHILHLFGCCQLIYLPQLPLSLKVLNAYGCKSLRTLSSCIQNHNLSQIKWNFGDCVKLDLDMCSMLFNKFIDDVMNSAANYSPWLLLPTKYDTVNAGKNGSSDNNSLATTTFSHPQNLKGLIYYTFLHDDCFTDCVSCLPRAALSVECHSPNANGVGKGTFLSYCYCLSSYDNKEDPSKPRSYLLVWYDWDVMRKEIMNVATAKFKFQATYEGYSQQGGKVQVPILITSCGVIPVYRGSLEGDKEITVKMNWVEN
ncbi:Disease resistance protein RUN1 [Linum perenne]